MSDFITGETTVEESTVHFEDGIGMFSDVSEVDSGFCSVCFQDVPETREIQSVEFNEADTGRFENYRVNTINICVGCLARILVAPAHAKLSQGIVSDMA